jgi:hypothetical protein
MPAQKDDLDKIGDVLLDFSSPSAFGTRWMQYTSLV